jgi:thiamine pyrophosphokinase
MSSHHIIREKQEPALLILSLHSFSEELLGQLLEWSPTVIVNTDTYLKVDNLGIKIDALISNHLEESVQTHVKLIQIGDDQPVEAVLKYLINHDYTAVNIIADHIDLKDYYIFTDKINMVIYQGMRKIYAVSSNFSKWMPAGEILEIIGNPIDLKYSGLKEVDSLKYQTTHDGFFNLHFQQPFLFIAEYI